MWDIAKWPVLAVLVSLAFALLYWASPNVKQPGFRWLTPGGVLAVVVDTKETAASWMLSAVAGSRSRRRVTTPTATPHSAPAITSLGQCALLRSREWATATATATANPVVGLTHATAVVNAAAVAAWDEGNDDDVGLYTNA